MIISQTNKHKIAVKPKGTCIITCDYNLASLTCEDFCASFELIKGRNNENLSSIMSSKENAESVGESSCVYKINGLSMYKYKSGESHARNKLLLKYINQLSPFYQTVMSLWCSERAFLFIAHISICEYFCFGESTALFPWHTRFLFIYLVFSSPIQARDRHLSGPKALTLISGLH